MFLLYSRFLGRFHSGGQCQGEKSLSIPRIRFLSLPSKFAGTSQRLAEMAHTLRIWPAVNPVQESLFVQEKVAGQYALKGQLLKEIVGGHRHLTERILRIAGSQL